MKNYQLPRFKLLSDDNSSIESSRTRGTFYQLYFVVVSLNQADLAS